MTYKPINGAAIGSAALMQTWQNKICALLSDDEHNQEDCEQLLHSISEDICFALEILKKA